MIRSLMIALALIALAACSKPGAKDAASAPGASTAASANAGGAPTASAAAATAPGSAVEPPLPDLGEFKLVSVLMGNAVDPEHVVIHDTRQFAAKDAIYASVLSVGAHQGLKLSAEWIAPDGSTIATSEQPIVPSTDLATTFNISNPTGWPSGDYMLKIGINGHVQRGETFSVR